MADFLARNGRPKPESLACVRPTGDWWLRHGTALWAQRGRLWLLCGDDVVGRSADHVGYTRYNDFVPRYYTGCESTLGFRHRGCSSCLWSTIPLRPIIIPSAQTHPR